MKETDLKKEARYIDAIKAVYGSMKSAQDAHSEIDYAGLQTSIAKRISKVVLDLEDKAILSERNRCAEIARSYEPKLTDGGVEIKDEGIFVDINEAIATAINKDV